MFIIIIGTRASGKSTIREYLLQHKKFKHVRLVYSGEAKEGDASVTQEEDLPLTFHNNVIHQEISKKKRGLKIDTPNTFISMTSSSASNIADSPESNTVIDIDGALGFTDPSRLLEHITRNWRDDFVTEDITTRAVLARFLKRPSVLLVSVDAPTTARFVRFKKYQTSPPPPSKFSFFSNRILPQTSSRPNGAAAESLEQFVKDDDRLLFGADSDHVTSSYLFASHHLCHVNIINAYPTVERLYEHLEVLNLLNMDRLRPGWDSYFMKLADLASHRSNCMKRRVGAILVRNHTIIATGYNGTPYGVPNCNQGGCKRCNDGPGAGGSSTDGFEECLCIHAEENALLEAGRERVGKDAIIYCNTCPCLKCTIKIVQNGVREVVYNLSYKMDASSARVFQMAGVKLRQYSPPG